MLSERSSLIPVVCEAIGHIDESHWGHKTISMKDNLSGVLRKDKTSSASSFLCPRLNSLSNIVLEARADNNLPRTIGFMLRQDSASSCRAAGSSKNLLKLWFSHFYQESLSASILREPMRNGLKQLICAVKAMCAVGAPIQPFLKA